MGSQEREVGHKDRLNTKAFLARIPPHNHFTILHFTYVMGVLKLITWVLERKKKRKRKKS